MDFLRVLNTAVYREAPATQTIAEESTAWPQVSRPVHARRTGLRDEVEHGLDARHAEIHAARSDASLAITMIS